jgi:hypothetical protein
MRLAVDKLEGQIAEAVNLKIPLQKTRNCLVAGKAVKRVQEQAEALQWATNAKGKFARNLMMK